jgi:glycosyltransferase involved in cell wall biosynthesis
MVNVSTAIISIIIPAYRHAGYIGEAIQSVLGQSLSSWELIIINDGSPDNTAEVVTPFLSDPRISYFDQLNQGQAAARNRGLALARGEYARFLDDDDLLPNDALEWSVAYLQEHPSVSAVIGAVQYIDASGMSRESIQSREGTLDLSAVLTGKYPTASPGQTTFRTESLRRIGGFDPHLRNVDDFDLMCRLVKDKRVDSVSRLGLYYRWHGGNASSDPGGMVDAARVVISRHLASLKKCRRSAVRRKALALLEANYGMSAAWREVMTCPKARPKFRAILGYMVRSEPTLWLSPLWWKSLLRRIKHTRFGEFHPS